MKCATKRCKSAPTAGKLCRTCATRQWRAANPIAYAYQNLKDNAKRRGKFFDLTFEQFAQFCHETKYIAGKGRTAKSYSVDRVDPARGYTISNIRVLPLGENASKGQLEKKVLNYDWVTRTAYVETHTPSDIPHGTPF